MAADTSTTSGPRMTSNSFDFADGDDAEYHPCQQCDDHERQQRDEEVRDSPASLVLQRPWIIGPSIPRRRNVVDLVARSLAHGTAFCRTASVSGGPGAPKNISCRSRRSRTSTRVSSSGKYPGHNQYRRPGTNGQNDQFCTHHNFSAPPGVAKRIWVILLIKAAGSLALQHAASFEAMKGRFGSKFSRTPRSPPHLRTLRLRIRDSTIATGSQGRLQASDSASQLVVRAADAGVQLTA